MVKRKWPREMGQGNGIRPVNCKGRRSERVSVAVMEQMEISVCSICSIPACFWIVARGDSLRGFRLLLTCDRRAPRTFLKKLTILN